MQLGAHYGINLLENEAIICRIIVAKADIFYYVSGKSNIMTTFTERKYNDTCRITHK